ncbi:MAG: purine-nucleoside phosphorylase [Acidobacteria bacterium]|nr:purine-nucleoside phosphorylase [Acidobacteriota bacterium]
MYRKMSEAARAIRKRHPGQPLLGVVLGSGLGDCADSLERRTVIPFVDLPHFPASTVRGHGGKLVLGIVEGIPAAVLQGRAHYYEGYSMSDVTFPVRVLGLLGIRALIVSNAAGAVSPRFRPGDLMLITDHINLMGANPLRGSNIDELGPRFPDMSEAYDRRLVALALRASRRCGIRVGQGVYIGLSGPSYETPAEIRMCRTLGADAVGMSTVPEVVAANHMGIRVLGISCITNMAAGLQARKLSHDEVMKTAARVRGKFTEFLRETIASLGEELARAPQA